MSHVSTQEWRDLIVTLSCVKPSLVDVSRAMIPASEIDDAVINAYLSTLPKDKITCLPVGFSSQLHMQPFDSVVQFDWHTSCLAIPIAVGGTHKFLHKDHYVLAIIDRDFRELRLYNSIDGYDDLKSSRRLLRQLGYSPSTFHISTNISMLQEPGSADCGLFVCNNAAFEAFHPVKSTFLTRVELTEHVAKSLNFTGLMSIHDVLMYDEAQKQRHVAARDLEDALALSHQISNGDV